MINYKDLGKLIAEEITYEAGICFYPARFKVPHLGSWNTLKDLVARNYIKNVIVLISPKEVEGITADQSEMVWKKFLEADPTPKVHIQKSTEDSPIKDIYAYLSQHPKDKAVYIAYNKDEEDDPGYIQSLQKTFGSKVYGLPINDKDGGISAPKVRDILAAGDYDEFVKTMPTAVVQKGFADDIFKIVGSKIDDTKKEIRELKEAGFPTPLSYTEKLDEFVKFVSDGLGLQNVPKVEYLATTEFTQREHSFGGYRPDKKDIVVVVANRNLADIMRSLAHELVHARQDEVDGLQVEDGETGSEVENQANAVAGVIMRLYGKNNPDIYLDWVSASE